MNVLNPSEAQRKAMADYLSFNVDEVIGLYEVDAMIAAANSIPEGAPVGTIARRPDGGWVAHRTVGLDSPFWEYFRLNQNVPARKNQYDADSWPQIRPDEWPDQSGLDWLPPGEEPIVPRPDPAASNTDAVPMSEPKGEMFGVILKALASDKFYGVDAPYLALQVHNALRAAGYDADPTAQQEPATTHPVSPESTKCVPKPRVLPSLDCEEARDGTVWKPIDDRIGRRYKLVAGSWKSKVGDEEWYTLRSAGLLEERFGPFTEVIE